jgi:uncharacterized protein DUF4124
MRALACVFLLLAASAAQAQMYKCTDGGKTRFSDKPFTDCKSQPQPVRVQPNVALSTPARSYVPRPPHPDPKCQNLRREMQEVQRAGVKDAASEQRWQDLRTAYKPCN